MSEDLLRLADADIALLQSMPIANAGDHPEWDAILRMFNGGWAELYWNEETGERGMTLSTAGASALRARASIGKGE